MCGIAATIGIGDPTVFDTMFGALGHRGPDQSGTVATGEVRIGTHRLSIVGEDRVPLPLRGGDGRFLLAFNGEIYNHREIRGAFPGYDFRTATDGEVIFAVLESEGLAGLRRLRGMFAFVVVDVKTGWFLAARDPFGIKPLYYSRMNGGIAFASELKALAGLSCVPHFVPPGHAITSHGLSRHYHVPGGFWRRSRPPLRTVLEQAVASHMPERGPVGVFLSGGLDSSVIAALAARKRPDIVAYSVVLPGSPDEEPAAEVAAHLGIRHKVLRVSTDEARAAVAPAIGFLESFNPVMVRNAVPLFLLAKSVESGCKVVLGGDGSDEIFAGYDYLQSLPRRDWPRAMDYGFSNLHRTELQRVDRMTMAHGIELRVPFLDRAVAEAALDMPLSRKVGYRDGGLVTKLALREAVADLLPPSIRWRRKLPLTEGSGFAGLDIGGEDVFFDLWRARYPDARPDVAIWSDAGRYHGFKEDHGKPLLDLFRG